MTTPNPPQQPSQQNPQIIGTNQLAGRLDALTRAVGALTGAMGRGASGGMMNSMAFGPSGGRGARYYSQQEDRLGRRMTAADSAHAEARLRMQEDLQRLNQRVTAGQMSRGDYNIATRRMTYNMNRADNQHQAARVEMQQQLASLNAQQRAETRMNRMAATGQAVGAVAAGIGAQFDQDFYNSQAQFGRQVSMLHRVPGSSYGQRLNNMSKPLFDSGMQNFANSHADLFTAGQGLYENYGDRERMARAREASSLAMLTPGLGAGGAVDLQATLGSARGFYAARSMGLTPGRKLGGDLQDIGMQTQSMFSRSFQGRNMRQVASGDLEAALRPEGMLTRNINQFAEAAGMSQLQTQAYRNQLTAQYQLANKFPKMTDDEIKDVMEKSTLQGKEGDEARKKMSEAIPDFGKTALDAEYFKQGMSRSGMLKASASYQEAAVKGANTLIEIKEMMQPFFAQFGGIKGGYDKGGIAGAATAFGSNLKGNLKATNEAGLSNGKGGGWLNAIPLAGPYLTHFFGGQADKPGGKTQGEPDRPGIPGMNNKNYPQLPSGDINKVLASARAEIGDPYVLGANGPDAWDCSSLTEHAYRAIGKEIGPDTWAQWGNKEGLEVPMDQLQPGDLVFYGDESHVALYSGNGQVVEAPRPGKNVRETDMWGFTKAKRYVSGSVSANPTLGGSQNDPTKSWGGGGVGGGGGRNEVEILASALAGGGRGGGAWAPPKDVSNQNTNASGTGGGDKVTDANANVQLGRKIAAEYGWTGSEFDALYELWMGESEWKSNADNPSSDAYGIPQAMSNLYPETATSAWRNSPEAQIRWGLDYIKGRYKKPSSALSFWKGNNPHWYDRGAWDVPGDQVAKLHAGEMVLTKGQAATVRAALMEQGLGGPSGGGGGTVNINVGGVTVQMASASAEGAQSAAEQFVSFIAADERIKSLLGGW